MINLLLAFEMIRTLERLYFPVQLFGLLSVIVVPFKRQSYISDYFTLWNVPREETRSNAPENDRRRRCLWWQINAMLGYTFVLLFAQYCLDLVDDRAMTTTTTDVSLWRVAMCDLTREMWTLDPNVKLMFMLIVTMAICFNYCSYRKIELQFIRFADRILFRRTGWRRFFPATHYLGFRIDPVVHFVPQIIVKKFNFVIILTDISVITIVLPKSIKSFGAHLSANEHSLGIGGQITIAFACATNFVAQIGTLLVYEHFAILLGTLGMASLFALYVRITQNQIQVIRSKRLSTRAIDRFARYNVGSVQLLLVLNRVFGNIFLVSLLCNAPVNAYFAIGLALHRFDRSSASVVWSLAFMEHQVLFIFMLHFCMAQLSKRFHRSGRRLVGLFARNQFASKRKPIWIRLSLRVSLLIARLHVTRRYGLMYG